MAARQALAAWWAKRPRYKLPQISFPLVNELLTAEYAEYAEANQRGQNLLVWLGGHSFSFAYLACFVGQQSEDEVKSAEQAAVLVVAD